MVVLRNGLAAVLVYVDISTVNVLAPGFVHQKVPPSAAQTASPATFAATIHGCYANFSGSRVHWPTTGLHRPTFSRRQTHRVRRNGSCFMGTPLVHATLSTPADNTDLVHGLIHSISYHCKGRRINIAILRSPPKLVYQNVSKNE
jgi:hypothetical protein